MYPDLLEMDMERAYEGNASIETMKKILLPRLHETASKGDFDEFCTWMPFARKFATQFGYY